jgi:flagellar hook protein FlgE
MIQAFYTGLSGMQTSSSGIDIVSDNIANANTNGFRGSSYEFSSLFEDALVTSGGSISNSIGVGSRVQATPMTESSGSYSMSDRSTDLAIFGDGWFGIQGNGAPQYTRDGAFVFDSNSDLVTADGNYVLGTMGGNINGEVLTSSLDSVPLKDVGTQEKLRFPKTLSYPPKATTTATFSGNVGTVDEARTMSAGVVDSQSDTNKLQLTYTRAENQPESGTLWDVVAVTQSLDGETIYDTQKGTVAFDAAGALISNTLPPIDNNGTSVSIDLGTGFDGVVALSNTNIYASSSADGTVGGDLVGYDINPEGEVIATFTNGMQSSVGKVAVYHFQNDQGLERISGTRFAESSNSGKALFYQDANGQNIVGTEITNYKLESSNVDMTNGLTELIILQRSYDANSKSITTADEMIQKALEM